LSKPTKSSYVGLGGLPGLHKNPSEHVIEYAKQHPQIGIALGDIGHDAAAVLVEDGSVRFAIEEERLTRFKHIMALPELAEHACVEAAESELIKRAYYMNPSSEHLEQRLAGCRDILSDDSLIAMRQEFEASALRADNALIDTPCERIDHHLAHAASAFYPSGYERALVLVIDGEGESASTSLLLGEGGKLKSLARFGIESSLGYLYSNMTAFLGFEALEDEYKVMGLAAYGSGDEFRSFFDEEIQVHPDGSFRIPSLVGPSVPRLANWIKKLGMYRVQGEPIGDRQMAIAYSLQAALERTVLQLVEKHAKEHNVKHLCMAGGVALNCSMNGAIDRAGIFDSIYVQPAATDPGAALGAALYAYHRDHPDAPGQRLESVSLGPEYSTQEVEAALEKFAGQIEWIRPEAYTRTVAERLAAGEVFGWFSGRMEFGPRALGNRSILADPRREEMKDRVNKLVKKREEFRPFAPSVAIEGASEFFELREPSQYEFMTITVNARPERRSEIPSVVHVQGTSRVHLVRKEVNAPYHELLTHFGELTDVPVLMNTSFNVRGEPIVCTPEDAVRCFLGTEINALAIEGFIVTKRNS